MEQIFVVKSEKLEPIGAAVWLKGRPKCYGILNNLSRVFPQLRWAKDSDLKDNLKVTLAKTLW